MSNVQTRLILGFAEAISEFFEVAVATVDISPEVIELFKRSQIRTIFPSYGNYVINSFLKKFNSSNEATVWAEAWLREAFIEENSRTINSLVDRERFDFVINATNTVGVESDIWWVQGVSPETVLNKMNFSHGWQKQIARMIGLSLRTPNSAILRTFVKKSRLLIANSNYIKKYYMDMGIKVEDVVYTFPDMSGFKPLESTPADKYVLGYIGKETEIDVLSELGSNEMKVIAFGNKVVPGVYSARRNSHIQFMGKVSIEELVGLYSNALFTVFPFTNEPLGYIPVESMACGTPVLTYNKQGPSETVLNRETGWLVDDSDEFVKTGSSLWGKGFDRKSFRRNCITRASCFSPLNQAMKIRNMLT